jgi:Ca-activated chloride channel family protein
VIVLAFGLEHPAFASPERLIALLVVPIFVLFVYVVRRRRSRTRLLFPNESLLARTARSRPRRRSRDLPVLLLACALIVAGLAFARPSVRVETRTHGTTVVLLVDVSGSMQATDIRPERIYAAVDAMRQLVNELPADDKVGLVTFSDKVEVLEKPTTDHTQVENSLQLLAPEGGTAIGVAVAEAVRVVVSSLRSSGTVRTPGKYLPAAIVLESDGAQNRGGLMPFAAGKLAGQAGVRIYGVALGTAHGKVIERKGLFARTIPVPPDPGVVALLARESGGEAFDATSAAATNTIYRKLGESVDTSESRSEITAWFDLAAAVLLASSVLLARARGAALP